MTNHVSPKHLAARTASSARRRRLLASVGALAAVAAMVLPTPTPAGAIHPWSNYHWARSASPLALTLGDNVAVGWKSYLTTTDTDWSKSVPLERPASLDTTIAPTLTGKNCRAVAGRVEVCAAKYGANGWLGLASIWASGDHITQGTAKMNDTYFNTTNYNKPEWRNMVMCQEVGHTLGLGHVDEAQTNVNMGTCMDYTSNPAGSDTSTNNEHPNRHDYDQLSLIYEHLDTTVATSSASSSAGNSRAEWGRAVGKDGEGRDDHFVRDLGNGEQIITFVTWAN